MNTLQTAIAFPLLFLLIVFLLQLAPVLYMETDKAAEFHLQSVKDNLENDEIYIFRKDQPVKEELWSWISTSPEKIHFFIQAVKDFKELKGAGNES